MRKLKRYQVGGSSNEELSPEVARLRAETEKARKEAQDLAYKMKIENYYNTFQNSKKTDKIKPLQEIPLDMVTPELEEELKAQGLYINKTKDKVQLYPLDVIQKRIIDNGFRGDQFAKYWGLNSKDINTQFKDLIKTADIQYENTVLNKVLSESIKQGKSPEQIFNTLGPSWGVTDELKNKYLKKSQKELSDILDLYTVKLPAAQEYEFKDRPDSRYKNIDGKWYIKNDGTNGQYIELNDPTGERSQLLSEQAYPAYDTPEMPVDNILLNKGLTSEQKYTQDNQYSPEIAKQQLAQQYKEQERLNQLSRAITGKDYVSPELKAAREAQQKQFEKELWEDYDKMSIGEKALDRVQAAMVDPFGMTARFLTGDQAYYPGMGKGLVNNDSPYYNNYLNAVGYTPGEIEAYDIGNLVNPFHWGASIGDNLSRGNYGTAALETVLAATPIHGANMLKGVGKVHNAINKGLSYSPVKSAPWLNLNNTVVNPYFAYEAVKPGGLFEEAYTDFSKGNIGSGALNTAFGALSVAPYVKPLKEAASIYKTMSTPGSKVALPGVSKYAFGYKAPNQSQLFAGNPTLTDAVPAFESFTNPLNKFTKAANLGEFRIMKNPTAVKNATTASTATQPLELMAGSADEAKALWEQGYRPVTEANVRIRGGKDLTIDNIFNTRGQVKMVKSGVKALDTDVPLYRVEPEGITYSQDKLASDYLEWDHGLTSEMNQQEINSLLKEPNNFKYIDNKGQERIGNFFPQHTAGNWWSNVPIGTPGAPDYVTAKFAELDEKPILNLTANVPFSKLNKFSVKNDPQAMPFVGKADKEFILPSEFRENAIKNYKFGVADDITSVEEMGSFDPVDQQRLTNLTDEVIARKIQNWDSKEGRRRLQKMIDETPSLKGMDPDQYINILKNVNVWTKEASTATNELNAARNELLNLQKANESLLVQMEDSGYPITNDILTDLYSKENPLRDKIAGLEKNLSELNELNKKAAYWDPEAKRVMVDPSKFSEEDVRKVLNHEITHVPGSPNKMNEEGATNLDKELSKLELVDNDEIMNRILDEPTYGQQIISFDSPSGAAYSFGKARHGEDYWDKALEYFNTGSGGNERLSFASEIVQDLLDKGIIKHDYDNITPKMLRDHFDNYMVNKSSEKYPLRMYDIMQNKDKNFKILSSVLNNLPAIAAGAVAADAIMGDDEIDGEKLSEASMLALLGKFGKPSKKLTDLVSKIKLNKVPKAFVNAITNYFKRGYDYLPHKQKQYLSQYLDLAAKELQSDGLYRKAFDMFQYKGNRAYEWKLLKKLYNEGKINPETLQILSDSVKDLGRDDFYFLENPSELDYLTQALESNDNTEGLLNVYKKLQEWNEKIEYDKSNLVYKLKNKLINKDQYLNELIRLKDKHDASIDYLMKVREEYELLSDNEILQKNVDEYDYIKQALKLGKGEIKSFRTGEVIPTKAELSFNDVIYTLSGRDNAAKVTAAMQKTKVESDPVYRAQLQDNMLLAKQALPGAQLLGSSILVSELGVPHLTKDIDMIMTQKDYDKVKKVYPFVTQNGPASIHDVFNIGPEGQLDINVIKQDPRTGLALHDPNDVVSHSLQIFRQFFPELYQVEALNALKEKRLIQIPLTPEQLMERYNPIEKTIMDAYEAAPKSYTKEKHRYRPDAIISYAEEDKLFHVANAQAKYIKSLAGPNAQLAKQFPKESFVDAKKNLEILEKIKYPGNRSIIAKSPERMQLALNDWYIHNSTFTRITSLQDAIRISPDKSVDELLYSINNEWVPGIGGNARGPGLNNQELGFVNHYGDTGAHKQLNIMSDATDPLKYVQEVNYKLGGREMFTPEQSQMLKDIYSETLGKIRGDRESYYGWKYISEVLEGRTGVSSGFKTDAEKEALVKFLDVIDEKMGIRAIKSERDYNAGLYTSTISKVDETIDSIMITAINDFVFPKSYRDRAKILDNNGNIDLNKVVRTIENNKDFKKVKNILNTSLEKTIEKNLEYEKLIEKVKDSSEAKARNIIEKLLKTPKYEELMTEIKTKRELAEKLKTEYENNKKQADFLRDKIDDYSRSRYIENLIIMSATIAVVGGLGIFGVTMANKNEEDYKNAIRREQAWRNRALGIPKRRRKPGEIR